VSWSEEVVPEPENVEPMYEEHRTDTPSEPGCYFVQWFRDPESGVKYKRLRDGKGKGARVVWKRWRDS
jgi:quinol monooxygenase YgiN